MVAVYVFLIGLCLGSFVNALIWRVYKQAEVAAKKSKKKASEDLSIMHGRSMCTHCGHQLAAKDLIPVVSWLSLRGKCRYCGKKIEDKPLVELTTALLALLSYVAWPFADGGWTGLEIVAFGLWLLILTGLMALAVYDIRWYLLPDRIVFPLTAVGVVFVLVSAAAEQDIVPVGSALLAAVVISGLFYLLFQFSNGTWIGGGDVKLGVLLGFLAGGFLESMLLLFLASALGTLYALCIGLTGRRQLSRSMRIPFGPFLIAAAYIVVLFGANLIHWYSNLLTA